MTEEAAAPVKVAWKAEDAQQLRGRLKWGLNLKKAGHFTTYVNPWYDEAPVFLTGRVYLPFGVRAKVWSGSHFEVATNLSSGALLDASAELPESHPMYELCSIIEEEFRKEVENQSAFRGHIPPLQKHNPGNAEVWRAMWAETNLPIAHASGAYAPVLNLQLSHSRGVLQTVVERMDGTRVSPEELISYGNGIVAEFRLIYDAVRLTTKRQLKHIFSVAHMLIHETNVERGAESLEEEGLTRPRDRTEEFEAAMALGV